MADFVEKDPRKILAANARALSTLWFRKVNVTQFGKFTGIKQGGAQRVFSGTVDIELGTIEKIAKKAKLETWQMIAPAFGGAAPLEMEPIDEKVAAVVARVLRERYGVNGFATPERAAERLPPAPAMDAPRPRASQTKAEPQRQSNAPRAHQARRKPK